MWKFDLYDRPPKPGLTTHELATILTTFAACGLLLGILAYYMETSRLSF